MTNEEKIKYLNDFFDLKENFKYRGPKLLYKYRAFDDFSFDKGTKRNIESEGDGKNVVGE